MRKHMRIPTLLLVGIVELSGGSMMAADELLTEILESRTELA